MTKEEFDRKVDRLMQVRHIEDELLVFKEQLELVEGKLSGFGVQITDMPKAATPNHSKMEDDIIWMMEIKDKIGEMKNEISKKQKEVIEAIIKLGNASCRRVLTLRYVEGLKWDLIAKKMKLDRSTVFRIHRRAVEALEI